MEETEVYSNVIPPTIEDVRIYFSQKGMPDSEAECFFLFYEKKKWRSSKGNLLTNWKPIAYRWIGSVIQDSPWLFNKAVH